ncbi:hypothetical protein AGABI2DRAFT_122864 [Agaricus bisporus var. bisporus H97]|uniref:hypothetical protein n=1 Tax=Agaricus bisporus var. bisporus (strain H97 / ATCC MYA-4626 / FGSC 10389) TaxID=936046 RepID=UPI00029F8032|nr:hypothetical protein AGABI2DRAFT_122864 [Agaricus bisporus var. bisporus H97]EKV42135.1 hypothetical protein AGABI2DRAFT_122864 [Agaricus bisporus var. bisporus H97]
MADSEYDYLSSLSDSESEGDFSMAGPDSDDGKPRGRKGKKTGDYIITNALQAPRATTYTAQSLFDQIVAGDIDLDPEYQRDVVWPEAKQIGLVDSIFRNFYIPPVIFAVNAYGDGSESKICIDGKQRLTSIYRFMLGLIYHRDRSTNEKYWFTAPKSEVFKKRRNILPEKYRRLFSNKQIVCVEYNGINDKDEREIFQRVQLGMALTPAEKLGVVKTPRADFIREIQSEFFQKEIEGLGSLDWDRSRGTDFRCLLTILWCTDRYKASPANLSNIGSVPQFETFINDPNPVSQKLRDEVLLAFHILENMAVDSDLEISSPFRMATSDFAGIPGMSTKAKIKVSPVEFICMYLLVFVWKERASPREMARAIRDMRRSVRMEHDDIRTNTKVSKTMVTFIKSINPVKYQRTDDTDAEPASTQLKLAKSEPTAPTDTSSSSKRRRMDEDDPVIPGVAKPRTSTLAPRTANYGAASSTSPTSHSLSHASLTAAITTATSSSPVPTQTPTPTRGKGGLASLRAMTKQQMRGKSGGTSSNGDEG